MSLFGAHGPHHKSSHFYAFCVRPEITFEGQADGEEVLLLLRSHPITFIPWIIVANILFILPFILNVFLFDIFPVKEVLFFDLLIFVGVYTYVFVNILMWLFNVGIVTDERVVDVDYNYIVYKEVSGTIIDDVVDVTSKTSGFIRTFFRYGDVFVQTPGAHSNIDFLTIPEPVEVVSIINQLMENKDDRKENNREM